VAQARDERLRLPRAERRIRMVALAKWRPARSLGQLRVRRCFIDEDQPVGVPAKERYPPMDPEMAGLGDIKSAPFACRQTFFYG
jgi:hypothetical protein